MLSMPREIGQSLVIADDCIITIKSIRHGEVMFGIKSPKRLTVHRGEVVDAIKAGVSKEERLKLTP